jgi:hypothetical protein
MESQTRPTHFRDAWFTTSEWVGGAIYSPHLTCVAATAQLFDASISTTRATSSAHAGSAAGRAADRPLQSVVRQDNGALPSRAHR